MNELLVCILLLGQKIWSLALRGPEEGAKGGRGVAKVNRGTFELAIQGRGGGGNEMFGGKVDSICQPRRHKEVGQGDSRRRGAKWNRGFPPAPSCPAAPSTTLFWLLVSSPTLNSTVSCFREQMAATTMPCALSFLPLPTLGSALLPGCRNLLDSTEGLGVEPRSSLQR